MAAAALTISLITLNRYNSYHTKLNNYKVRIDEINNNYGEMAKELESAREAMQILTDNDNNIADQIKKMIIDLESLKNEKIAKSLVAQPNRFNTSRANGQ